MSLGRRIGIVTVLSVLANVAALAKHAAIAARFGVSGTADLVTYAETVLMFLPTLFLIRESFGLFVSVYARTLEGLGVDEAARLYRSGLRLVLLAGGALSLAVFLFPAHLMRLIAPGLPPEQMAQGAFILRAVSPALILQEIAEFSRTVHNAHHRYAKPGLVILGGNLLQTAILLSFSPGRAVFAWILALNSAALLQASVMALSAPSWRAGRGTPTPLFHPRLKTLAGLVAPVALGVVLVQIAGYIERAVLSYLSAGSLAMLAYSRKLIAPLQTVLASSVALPIYVQMSRAHADRSDDRSATLARGVEINLFLFLPITAFVFLLAPQIVEIAFRRGLFEARDVAATAPLLRIGVLAILPASMLLLARDFFYASAGTRPLVIGGVVQLACTSVANLLLAPRYGIAWIPAGVVTGIWITCGILFGIVRARHPGIPWRALLKDGAKVACGSLALLGVGWLARATLPRGGLSPGIEALADIAAAGSLGLIVFFAVTLALGHPMIRALQGKLGARE